MLYNEDDKIEFKIQIKELLNLKLIRMSKSPHSSPAFMVRNHAEIKRGKARMVINYKELNKNCLFDGYFIPNKNNLINLAKGNTYFSKFDCKSGFRMQRMFARDKISYHEYQEVEKVIEITQTTGKHKLNLLTKPMIDQILRKIPERKRKINDIR